MTNTELLNWHIQKSGLKKGYLAMALGIPASTLSKKLNNERNFTPEEIVILCKLLGIKTLKERDAVFFAEKVAKPATE
jgi:plasmid maintenance system antidote protein VapI